MIDGRFALHYPPAAPFIGLSVIDSLFCDVSMAYMRSYMEWILKSALPAPLKARVLRLDYPDRGGLPRMHAAQRLYVDTIRASGLPRHLKEELTHGMLSTVEAGCQLL